MRGKIGSTHGERIDSTPARKARTRVLITTGQSQGLVQQRRNRREVCVPDRSALLFVTPERDQGGLHSCPELRHQILLAVEIDDKVDQVLDLGSAINSLRMGFCALQVGHQEA